MSDHYPVDVLIQTTPCVLRVGAFNVEILGVTKIGKQDVVDILVKV